MIDFSKIEFVNIGVNPSANTETFCCDEEVDAGGGKGLAPICSRPSESLVNLIERDGKTPHGIARIAILTIIPATPLLKLIDVGG